MFMDRVTLPQIPHASLGDFANLPLRGPTSLVRLFPGKSNEIPDQFNFESQGLS